MATHNAVLHRLRKFTGRAVLAVAVLLAGFLILSRCSGDTFPTVFGWGSVVVLSGSMEPALPVGSLLLVHEEETYTPGEIITYEDSNGYLVTHRLVSLEGGTAVARGDANNTQDRPFEASKIRGKVQAAIPALGGLLLWLRTPAGFCTLLLASGCMTVVSAIGRKEETGHGTEGPEPADAAASR